MAKRRKPYADDDGRVIAKMNVPGMPWHRPGPSEEQRGVAGRDDESDRSVEPLSRRETLMIMLHSMKWAFLFALAFSVLLVAFVLFCVFVWFK